MQNATTRLDLITALSQILNNQQPHKQSQSSTAPLENGFVIGIPVNSENPVANLLKALKGMHQSEEPVAQEIKEDSKCYKKEFMSKLTVDINNAADKAIMANKPVGVRTDLPNFMGIVKDILSDRKDVYLMASDETNDLLIIPSSLASKYPCACGNEHCERPSSAKKTNSEANQDDFMNKLSLEINKAADHAVKSSEPIGMNSNIPNIMTIVEKALAGRDDVIFGIDEASNNLVLVPKSIAENFPCACGKNCNQHKPEASETKVEQPEPNTEAKQSGRETHATIKEMKETTSPKVANLSTPTRKLSATEVILAKAEEAILTMYPQATHASKGIKVGDVLTCHVADDSVVVTPDNIHYYATQEQYFVIANIGNHNR